MHFGAGPCRKMVTFTGSIKSKSAVYLCMKSGSRTSLLKVGGTLIHLTPCIRGIWGFCTTPTGCDRRNDLVSDANDRPLTASERELFRPGLI